VRALAARVVAEVAVHGRSLDRALEDVLARPRESSHGRPSRGDRDDRDDLTRSGMRDPAGDLSRQDRGLLRALSYDSLRWYLRLDALLGRLLVRPNQPLPSELRALAVVGLCQLLHMDIPAHAAVAQTVEAARVLGHPRAAGLINAVLRRAQREHEMLLALVDRDPALRSAHPRWLAKALERDWGGEAERILEANNQHPPFWLRVNRLRGTGAQYRARLEAAGLAVAASRFDDEALRLHTAADVADLPGFAQGLPGFAQGDISVQDAAAQLAARLMAPLPGERILDACAAPGGKTGHLLELQPALESLVAVDVSLKRLKRVADNLKRLGFRSVQYDGVELHKIDRGAGADASVGEDAKADEPCLIQLVAADAAEPSSWWDGVAFDRILLDVPCSATGVIRRHPDIKLLRRAEDIPALAARQLQLLQRLWPLLAPGGRLVYASCSALLAETREVVTAFLASQADARDISSEALHAARVIDEIAAGVAAETSGRTVGRTAGEVTGRTPGGAVGGNGHGAGHGVADGVAAADGTGIGMAGLKSVAGEAIGHRIAAGTAGMDGFYYACVEKTKE